MDRFVKRDRFVPTIRQGCVYGSSIQFLLTKVPVLVNLIDPSTGRPINDITCLLRAQNKLTKSD